MTATGVEQPNTVVRRRWSHSGWIPDALIVAVIVGVWLGLLTGPVLERRPIGYDTYRDAAYAEHILAGDWHDDPALLGYEYWYPPLGPMLYAAVSRVFGVRPLNLYGTSVLWINVLILPLVYLLARTSFDRLTAATAVLCVWLGSRWWSESLALPIPAVQGLVPGLAAIWLWVSTRNRGPAWAAPVGVLLAACTWHHVVCGMIASAAIGGDALLRLAIGPRTRRRAPLLRAAIAGVTCGILVAPLAWHLLSLPTINTIPGRYAPANLFTPGYTRHADTPLIPLLALVGLSALYAYSRRTGKGMWVVGYALAGLFGMAPAYLQRPLARRLPMLVPHEFQWHMQLAVCILAAVGVVWLARTAVSFVGRRVHDQNPAKSAPRPMPVLYAWGCVMILAVGLNAPGAARRIDDLWVPSELDPEHLEAAGWIRANTGAYDVFAATPRTGYEVVGALTGRKLLAPRGGWANVSAPVDDLHHDLGELLQAQSCKQFMKIARTHAVRWFYVDSPLRDRLDLWLSCPGILPVFQSVNGRVTILELDPAEP